MLLARHDDDDDVYINIPNLFAPAGQFLDKFYQFQIQSFHSPKPVAIPRLKSPVYLII